MICVDLLLDNGEIVRIEAPNNVEDELHDSIDNAMKRRDWWSRSRFDGSRRRDAVTSKGVKSAYGP